MKTWSWRWCRKINKWKPEAEDDVEKEINENLKLKMMSKKKKRKPEVEDDVEKEINENLKLKMMSKNK